MALEVLSEMYGQNVDFYGNDRSRQEVMADKESLARRWPERSYSFRIDRKASYCRAGRCVIKGQLDWHAHSPERDETREGVSEATIGLQQIRDTFTITSEHGKVIHRY